MLRLAEAAEPAFARHESFHPRFGWLKKAYDAAASDPTSFTAPDAPVRLGVGKNMVAAIRFWGRAAKVLVDVVDPDRPRLPRTVPSERGSTLLADDGLDPYLELPGSPWLLHWWMLEVPSLVPVWWAVFNDFRAVEFAEDDVKAWAVAAVDAAGWPDKPMAASIEKDVAVLLHMYSLRPSPRASADDILDSPFRELGLLHVAPDDRRRYRFAVGRKPGLPAEVVAFACLDYLATWDPSARTSTLVRLARDPGSPGRAFRLDEASIATYLDEAAERTGLFRLATSAGATQVGYSAAPNDLAAELLRAYYGANGGAGDGPLRLGAGPADGAAVREFRGRRRRLQTETEIETLFDPIDVLVAHSRRLAGRPS